MPENIFNKEFENCGQIKEEIDKLEDNIPDKRNKKEYDIWKEKVNILFGKYNEFVQIAVYKLIK